MTQLQNNSDDSTSNSPLVSVGIATYNRPDGLRRTLECITRQTYKNLEIIVSDNCSQDLETENIIKEFAERDARIQYYRQEENRGGIFNIQFVLGKANGEFFLWATDDDERKITFIASLVSPLRENPERVTAFCPYIFIDSDRNSMSEPIIFDYSSQHRIIRLIKLCFYHDDIFIYGIHRTKALKKTNPPIWWGINAKSPINTAFPRLFYLLSLGDFALVGSSPLFMKHLRTEVGRKDHYFPFVTDRKNPFFAYIAFLLLKINVIYECEKSIWQSSKSVGTVIFCFFPLAGEAVFDCLNIFPKIIYFFRKKRPIKINRSKILIRWY